MNVPARGYAREITPAIVDQFGITVRTQGSRQQIFGSVIIRGASEEGQNALTIMVGIHRRLHILVAPHIGKVHEII